MTLASASRQQRRRQDKERIAKICVEMRKWLHPGLPYEAAWFAEIAALPTVTVQCLAFNPKSRIQITHAGIREIRRHHRYGAARSRLHGLKEVPKCRGTILTFLKSAGAARR